MDHQGRWSAITGISMILAEIVTVLNAGCVTRKPARTIPLQSLYPHCRTATASVAADGLDADLFWTDSQTPKKAVILLGGSEGGKGWSEDTARVERLVDEGYFVISLAYFADQGLPVHQRRIPLEYFAAVFDWLSRQKGIVSDDYALIGASRGAELALLLAGRYSQIKAVAAIAPSSVVFPGPPTNPLDALMGQHSAWACEGKELPFVPMPYSVTTIKGMLSGRRTKMFEAALQNARLVEAAAIPVEKANASILLVSFTRDQIWPSTRMAEQIMDRLKAADYLLPYRHIAYDAGHCDCGPDPCWTTIVDFFREHFKDRPGQLTRFHP